MNIAVCGSSVLELEAITEQIRRIEPGKHRIVVGGVSCIINMAYAGEQVDLCFCDVDNNNTAPSTQIRKLNEAVPHALIVLISSGPALFLECIEYIWRYELKPITPVKIKSILMGANKALSPQRIILTTSAEREKIVLNIHHIVFIEMFNKLGVVHMVSSATYTIRTTLTKLENELGTAMFYKPHKSYLVNIEYIQYVSENEIWMYGDAKIPLSRNWKGSLFKLLSNYSNIIYV